MPTSLHIYASGIASDSRIYRQATELIAERLFDRVIVLGIKTPGLPDSQELSPGVTIHRLSLSRYKMAPVLKSVFFYLEWYYCLWQFCRKNYTDLDAIQCHSLYDLPAGSLLKRRYKAPLVYDAHELEPHRNGISNLGSHFLKWLENWFIGQADVVFTVSQSILEWYRSRYSSSRIELLRNLPIVSEPKQSGASGAESPRYFHKHFNLPEGSLVFLYLGALMRGRAIPQLIAAFEELPASFQLVFMGDGPYREMVDEAAQRRSNIHRHPSVPPNAVVEISRSADVGLAMIENICLSYYYCLPNKLFEYMNAGIPVLCSDFPDMLDAINRYGGGWYTEPTAEALVKIIDTLDAAQIAEKKQALTGKSIESWADEKGKFIAYYKSILEAA